LGLALEEPSDTDETIVNEGVRVYLDQRVAHWFDGAVLDFKPDEWGGEFTFSHPDVSRC